MRTKPRALLLAVLAASLATPTLAGLGEQAGEPLEWSPVPDHGSSVPAVAPRASGVILDFGVLMQPVPRRPVVQLPAVGVRVVVREPAARGTHRLAGLASWFCRAGLSACTKGYPPGSMVAAACGKLRAAMGGHWRGRVVTVRSGSRSVRVQLVDWCGSTSKTIDLYWEPMRRLGGTGVLFVTVSW